MSTTIDQRVVSMQFDNKNFERNVQTSLSTIDKLKRSLNFGGASKSLGSLDASVKKVNMSPLSSAVDTVRLKFSALEVMAVTALANITNSAVNAGKRLVSAFTIDPIKSGFQEYETQINAIQTILANTESKGTTLDDVNKALDTLNKYADKTIYNFTEMTRNIGTFTAAGIDLDTSVNAIQGIANLAAVSGSTSQQASTAMYQLSQALASGTVKLQDWNSVVNASMGGQVFQDALIETARVHGIKIDEMIKKQGAFRNTLSEGWLTSEILTETLMKFTLTTEGLTDAQIEQNRAMLKAKGYSDDQIEKIFKLGQTATDAATKVKTFTQLMDTLKEAAQSGWTKTWELIVGDFDDAKNLWTMVSDTFGEMIGNSADRRNNFLSKVLSGSTWDDLVKGVNEAGIETKDFESAISKTLTENGINVDKLVQKYGSLEEAFKKGAVSSKYLKEALKGLNGGVKESLDFSGAEEYIKKRGKMQFRTRNEAVNEVEKALKQLGYNFVGSDGVDYGEDGFYGQLTEKAVKDFQKKNGLKVTGIVDDATLKKLKEATSITKELDSAILDLVDGVTNLGGREVLIEGLCNVFKGLMSFITPIREAFWSIFSISPENLYKMIEGFRDLTAKFKLSDDNAKKLKTAFEGLFSVIGIGRDFIKVLGGGFWNIAKKVLPVLGNGFLDASSNIGEWLKNLRKTIAENKVFENLIAGTSNLVGKAADKIKEWYGQLKAFFAKPEIQKWLADFKDKLGTTATAILDKLKQVGNRVAEFFNQVKNGDFSSIKEALSTFKTNVIDFLFSADTAKIFDGIIGSIKNFKDAAKTHLVNIGIHFDNLKTSISNFFNSTKGWLKDNAALLVSIAALAGTFLLLNTIKNIISGILEPLSGFNDLCHNLGVSLKTLSKGVATKARADAILSIAKAIGVLVGSVVALTMLDSGKLWQATGAMAILIGGLIGLVIALNKSSKALDSLGNLKNTVKISSLLLSIAGAIFMISLAAKVLGTMDAGSMAKAALAIAGIVLAIKLIAKYSASLNGVSFLGVGKAIFKISAGLLFMAIAIKMLGSMDAETLLKGGGAIAALLTIIALFARMTSGVKGNLGKFGTTMIALSGALILLSAAVGIFGRMKKDELIQGGLAITAFLTLMVGLMAATKLLAKDMPKFGATMIGLGAGLMALALAVQIFGRMDTRTLVKGGIVVTAFTGLIVGLMAATQLLGEQSKNLGKVSLTMLAFSTSLLLISASIAALSLISGKNLAKATAAIGAIGIIFAGLIAATRKAQGIKWGTLVGMSAAIAVISAAIVALAFVPADKLVAATASISAIIGMFAVLVKVTSKNRFKPSSLIPIAGMALIIGGLYVLISELSKSGFDASKARDVTAGITALLIGLAGATYILAKASNSLTWNSASIGKIAGIAAVISGIALIVAGIAVGSLPRVGAKLSEFAVAAEPFFNAISDLKADNINGMSTAVQAIAGLTAAVAKFAMADFVTLGGSSRAFTSLTGWFSEILPVIKGFALELSGSDVTINKANLTAVMDAVKTLAEAAASAPVAIAAGGGFASKWASGGGGVIKWPLLDAAKNWIIAVAPIVKDLAVVTSIIGSRLDTTKLTAIVTAAKTLAEAAALAPSVTVGAAGGGFASKWGSGGAGGAVVQVPMLDAAAKWIVSVAPVLKSLAIGVTSSCGKLNTGILTSIVTAAKTLAEAAALAPTMTIAGGLFGSKWVIGGGAVIEVPMLKKAAEWIKDVKDPLIEFAKACSTGVKLNKTNLESILDSAIKLSDAMGKIPKKTIGGFLFGSLPLKLFGGGAFESIPMLDEAIAWIEEIKDPLIKLADACTTGVKKINKPNLEAILGAATTLSDCISKIPKKTYATGGGIVASLAGFIGAGGFTFQSIPMLTEAAAWISAIKEKIIDFAVATSGESVGEINTENLTAILTATNTLSKSISKIPKKTIAGGGGGVLSWLAGFVGGAGFGFESIPMLDEAVKWFTDIKQPLIDFAQACSTGVDEINGENLTSIATAALTLSEAASKIPKKLIVKGGGFFAGLPGFLGAGGVTYESSTELTEAAAWFSSIKEPIMEFAKLCSGVTDEDKALMDSLDIDKFNSIIGAVKTLSEASSSIPKQLKIKGWFAGITGGQFEYQETTQFTEVTQWFQDVVPKVNELAEIISQSTVTIDTTRLSAVTTAVKTLAEASNDIPETSWVSRTFGSVADFTGFTTFIGGLADPLAALSTKISSAEIDGNKIRVASESVKYLAMASSYLVKEGGLSALWDGSVQWKSLSDNFGYFGDGIKNFYGKLGDFNPETTGIAAKAVRDIGEAMMYVSQYAYIGQDANSAMFENFNSAVNKLADAILAFNKKLANVSSTASIEAGAKILDSINGIFTTLKDFPYDSIDVDAFKSKTGEIGTAVKEFSTKFKGIDPSDSIGKIDKVVTMLKELKVIDLSGPDSFKAALQTLSETSIEDFCKAFENSDTKITSAISTMMQAAGTAITTEGKTVKSAAIDVALSASKATKHWLAYMSAYSAGVYVVQGFSRGITASTFMATAAAVTMAQAALNAARALLKINSPSKVFMKVGQSVPEGFSMGIDKLGGMVVGSTTAMAENALDGTRRAIARISDIVNSDIDSQPTIRPVIDLTDVENGANAIDGLFGMNPSVSMISRLQGINASVNSRQNGSNGDVISAIKDLGSKLGNMSGNTYNVNGVTYDDGSNISDAVKTLIRAARVERRI